MRFGFYGQNHQHLLDIVFRTMELDRKILGRAYIARIKAMDVYGGVDQLYAIAYNSPKEEMDHNLFKSVCSTHNRKFFYSKTINKKSATFTMRECLDQVVNYPKIGTSGLSMLEYPVTLSGFGRIAYEQEILVSKSGYDLLDADTAMKSGNDVDGASEETNEINDVPFTAPAVAISKIRKSILKKKEFGNMMDTVRKQAEQLKDVSFEHSSVPQGDIFLLSKDGSVMTEEVLGSSDIPVVGVDEIIAPAGDGFENLTMEALRDRCLLAEMSLDSLTTVVEEKDAQILTLKKKLESATENSEKFMNAAALADVQRREYRADNASEVVDGLKPEFNLLKGVSIKMDKVSSSVEKGSQEQVLVLTEISQTLDDLPRKLQNFADGVQKTLSLNIKTMVNEVSKVLLAKQHESYSNEVEDQRSTADGLSIKKFTDYADEDTDVEVIEDEDKDIETIPAIRTAVIVATATHGNPEDKVKTLVKSKTVEFVLNEENRDAVRNDAQTVGVKKQGNYLLQQSNQRDPEHQGLLQLPRSNNNMRPGDVWIQPPRSFQPPNSFQPSSSFQPHRSFQPPRSVQPPRSFKRGSQFKDSDAKRRL